MQPTQERSRAAALRQRIDALTAQLIAARKTAIIGNAGGGKSELARALGAAVGVPVHSVDNVQWLPGWQRASTHAVASAHSEWIAASAWIIDGWGSWDLIVKRVQLADVTVLVDFPVHLHYSWAVKRQQESELGLTAGWPPPGCDASSATAELFRVMRYVDSELLPRVRSLLAKMSIAPRVVVVRTPDEIAGIVGMLGRLGGP